MKTSWKSVCQKLKMSATAKSSRAREGSDTSFTSSASDLDVMSNNSSTPIFNNNRSPYGNEWQLNMPINRREDL